MRTTLTGLHRDERGMSLVFVGVGFMAFLAATTLAIDVGMFMTARSQAQNSADAGALLGRCRALLRRLQQSSAERPGGAERARRARTSNDVISAQVSVQPGDVTFPTVARRPEQPRARARLPHRRARQPAADADGQLLRRQHGQHRRRRHRRSLAGQRDDVRQAVHDSRQVDREAGSGRLRLAQLDVRHGTTTTATRWPNPDSTSPPITTATPATTPSATRACSS